MESWIFEQFKDTSLLGGITGDDYLSRYDNMLPTLHTRTVADRNGASKSVSFHDNVKMNDNFIDRNGANGPITDYENSQNHDRCRKRSASFDSSDDDHSMILDDHSHEREHATLYERQQQQQEQEQEQHEHEHEHEHENNTLYEKQQQQHPYLLKEEEKEERNFAIVHNLLESYPHSPQQSDRDHNYKDDYDPNRSDLVVIVQTSKMKIKSIHTTTCTSTSPSTSMITATASTTATATATRTTTTNELNATSSPLSPLPNQSNETNETFLIHKQPQTNWTKPKYNNNNYNNNRSGIQIRICLSKMKIKATYKKSFPAFASTTTSTSSIHPPTSKPPSPSTKRKQNQRHSFNKSAVLCDQPSRLRKHQHGPSGVIVKIKLLNSYDSDEDDSINDNSNSNNSNNNSKPKKIPTIVSMETSRSDLGGWISVRPVHNLLLRLNSNSINNYKSLHYNHNNGSHPMASLSLPEGWLLETWERLGGRSKGKHDFYWYSPLRQKKFRSKIEVIRFLDLLQQSEIQNNEDLAYHILFANKGRRP